MATQSAYQMSLLQEINQSINELRRIELILRYYSEAFRLATEPSMIGDGQHVPVVRGPPVPPQEYRYMHETLNFELEGPLVHRYSGSGDAEQSLRERETYRILFEDFEWNELERQYEQHEFSEQDEGPLNLALVSLGRHWSEAQPHFSPQQNVTRRSLLVPRLTLKVDLNCSYLQKIFKTFAKMGCRRLLRLAYSELFFMV